MIYAVIWFAASKSVRFMFQMNFPKESESEREGERDNPTILLPSLFMAHKKAMIIRSKCIGLKLELFYRKTKTTESEREREILRGQKGQSERQKRTNINICTKRFKRKLYISHQSVYCGLLFN